MDSEREFNRRSADRQNSGRIQSEENHKDLENKNIPEHGLQPKPKSSKPSMIPVKKNEKSDGKNVLCKKRSTSSSMLSSASKKERDYEDFERKLKILKQKEKSIAGYYLKIQGIIQKMLAEKKEDGLKKPLTCKMSENPATKRMISEPFILSERKTRTNLSDFENNIQQISQIWLKTTAELSSTLKKLKSNPTLNPIEIQMENIRIQLAIKQAKSLTLVKTRNVIEEAKKLFRNREIIRTELECLLNHERCKLNSSKSQETLKQDSTGTEEQGVDGTGDSVRESDSESIETNKETSKEKHFKKEKTERSRKEGLKRHTTKYSKEDSFSEEKDSSGTDDTTKEPISLDEYCYNSDKMKSEIEELKKELAEKNKTVTNLNKKIFDLQKTCNENSIKYNQLQSKLFEFQEKIQWNQVLWKQIGKLKDRIKVLQQSVKELEYHKRELETKMSKREQEIDKLTTLNHILSQKRHVINSQKITIKETQEGESKTGETSLEKVDDRYPVKADNRHWIDEKIIAEKQAAINQLKKILNVMKDQENFAQKQIHMFQTKIEELEKSGRG